ncbi:MAG: phosphoribosylamine--glycine ligase, partial [Planctomycetota bacterium]
MDVLLIGGGGREHALAWKLAQSKNLGKLYIAPGNAGTAKCGENVPIGAAEVEKLVDFAKEKKVGLAIVGPEAPLAAGIVDLLEAAGIKAFGPGGEAAKLEADKAFAKQLMRACAISTAEGRIFDRFGDAKAYIASRDEAVVVKAAGLAAGKGVYVCEEPSDGILAAEKIMCDKIFGSAGDKLIVEDRLLGEEASILAFVDGRNI